MCCSAHPGTNPMNLVVFYLFSQEVDDVEILILCVHKISKFRNLHLGFPILNPIFHSIKTSYATQYVKDTLIYFILILK